MSERYGHGSKVTRIIMEFSVVIWFFLFNLRIDRWHWLICCCQFTTEYCNCSLRSWNPWSVAQQLRKRLQDQQYQPVNRRRQRELEAQTSIRLVVRVGDIKANLFPLITHIWKLGKVCWLTSPAPVDDLAKQVALQELE